MTVTDSLIDLDKCKTTLVHGTTGSGKSTLLDALCYGLFGKSFRGVNLTQLINTQNKKGLYVEVEFNIGKDTFLICRGMKPKVFEVFKNKEILAIEGKGGTQKMLKKCKSKKS